MKKAHGSFDREERRVQFGQRNCSTCGWKKLSWRERAWWVLSQNVDSLLRSCNPAHCNSILLNANLILVPILIFVINITNHQQLWNYQNLHDHRHWKCGWTHSNNLMRRWQPGLEARSIINWQPVNIMTWPSKEYRTWSPCLTFLSSIHFDAASEQRELLFRPDDWKGIIAKGNIFT